MAMTQDKSPDIIYHYTDGTGLIGIMQSQSLWATDYRYLNDYSELKILHEYMLGKLERLSYNPHIKKEVEQILSVFLPEVIGSIADNPLDPKIFVTSFCRCGDLLSQWRGYGLDGGYAIGFDYPALDTMRKDEYNKRCFFMSLFDFVVYNDETIPKSFENSIDNLINMLGDFFNKPQPQREEALKLYIENLPLLKHKGFFEEQEYRLVFATKSAQVSDIKFRYRSGVAVPYIVLFGDEHIPLPIREIVVGPSQDAELRVQSIQLMLVQKGLNPDFVKLSSIPYVCQR